jgi:hypothetical protein
VRRAPALMPSIQITSSPAVMGSSHRVQIVSVEARTCGLRLATSRSHSTDTAFPMLGIPVRWLVSSSR